MPSLMVGMDVPLPSWQVMLSRQATEEERNKRDFIQIVWPSYASPSVGYQNPDNSNFVFNLAKNSPLLLCTIVRQKELDRVEAFIPAHYFYNCDDGSLLDIPFIVDAKRQEPLLNLKLVCQKNTDLVVESFGLTDNHLKNKNFRKQFNGLMELFYDAGPEYTINCLDSYDVDQLIEDEVLSAVMLDENNPDPMMAALVEYRHGPQGCPTKECFKELMLKNAKKPYGNNTFNYLMGRQIGRALPRR